MAKRYRLEWDMRISATVDEDGLIDSVRECIKGGGTTVPEDVVRQMEAAVQGDMGEGFGVRCIASRITEVKDGE